MKQLFNSFCVYQMSNVDSLSTYEQHLAALIYKPCTGAETIRRGFYPTDQNKMITCINDYEIGRIKVMTKSVPKSEVRIQLNELRAKKEDELGVALSKDQVSALETALTQKLIGQAFPTRNEVYFILDKRNHYLFIGANTTSKIEHVIGLLKNAIPNIDLRPVITDINPSDALTGFVRGDSDEFDELYTFNGSFVLGEQGVSKVNWQEDASVALKAIKQEINTNKFITSVGLKCDDDSAEFKVDEYLHFSGLKLDKELFDDEDPNGNYLILADKVSDIFNTLSNLMMNNNEE